MSLVVLAVVLWFTGLLTDMPKAVLAAIVFLIGVGLIDVKGFQRIRAARMSEFVIAAVTAVVVFAVGVEQGIILAVVLSILEIIRRSYSPKDFLVGVDSGGSSTYEPAQPGHESLPGLLVFRFDARLFYANANRFADTVQTPVGRCADQGPLAGPRLLVDGRRGLLGKPHPCWTHRRGSRRRPSVCAGRS